MADAKSQPTGKKADDVRVANEVRNAGTPPADSHLQQKQKRNTALTQESQENPTGGAHSGTPDVTQP